MHSQASPLGGSRASENFMKPNTFCFSGLHNYFLTTQSACAETRLLAVAAPWSRQRPNSRRHAYIACFHNSKIMSQPFSPECKVLWNVRKHGDRFDVQAETDEIKSQIINITLCCIIILLYILHILLYDNNKTTAVFIIIIVNIINCWNSKK